MTTNEEHLDELEEEVDKSFLLVTFDEDDEPEVEAHSLTGIEVLGLSKWLEKFAWELLTEEGY